MSEKPNTELPPLPPMLRHFNPSTAGDRPQLYTSDQMHAYGLNCYERGRLRAKQNLQAKADAALALLQRVRYDIDVCVAEHAAHGTKWEPRDLSTETVDALKGETPC